MYKRIVAVLLCMLLSVPLPTMADEPIQEEGNISEVQVYTLSLNDAINIALEDNPELAVCDYQRKSYEYSLSAARIAKKNSKNAEVMAIAGYETAYVQNGYYIDLFTSQIQLADLNKEKTKASITYKVIQNYYQYKSMENLVNIMKNSYQLALKNKAIVDKQNELGMISEIEVINAQMTVDNAKNMLDDYERKLYNVREVFKIALNIDQECDFILTSLIDIPEFKGNLAVDSQNAMDSRYDVKALKEGLTLAEKHLNITERAATKSTAAYYNDLSSYMKTKANTDSSLRGIRLSVKQSYDAVISTFNNMTIAKQKAEIKKKLYEAANLQFEMGMITNIELTTKLTDYLTSNEDLENAKLTYKLAFEKYNYDITIGL